jgi:hypothetical protein
MSLCSRALVVLLKVLNHIQDRGRMGELDVKGQIVFTQEQQELMNSICIEKWEEDICMEWLKEIKVVQGEKKADLNELANHWMDNMLRDYRGPEQ